MQNYQEKAIPLISRKEDSKYSINPQALELLQSIQGNLSIISVAGIYRTGKSFLLNTILLNNKNTGFAVGPTTNPKTKGIWLWGKPLIYRNENDEVINVLIMDSQGLGSTEQDVNHDLRIFSITLLLSSCFMYNTIGAIDENAIDSLGVVLRLCEHLKDARYNDFPDFYWILRDFSLALVDKDNNSLTPKMYLESCLASQNNDLQLRNKIRHTIKQAFKNRSLSTFIRPLMDESTLQCLDKKPFEELRPEFIEQVLEFRKHIFNNLRIKSIKGKNIDGRMLGQLLKIYVDTVNQNKIPVIENGWEQLCLKQLHEVLQEIQNAVEAKILSLKSNLPRSKKQLQEEQKKILQQFQQIFRKRLINNPKAQQYFGTAIQQIVSKQLKKKDIESQMKVKNNQQVGKFVKKQFESIEKRLKQGQFKSMGQLVKQFEIFYEYYCKKCPYKDEIPTGMQYLVKKFSDCSLTMYKSQQKKNKMEIQQLNQQIKNLTSTYIVKEEKQKNEKIKMQDQHAKMEMKLQQLVGENSRLNKKLIESQQKIQQLIQQNNKSLEQSLEQQNLILKKNIMQMENTIQQLKCDNNHQVSELKQQILLKENQIQNLERYRAEMSIKMDEIASQQTASSNSTTLKIESLTKQLQELNYKNSVTQLALKQRIAQKEAQIKKLENALQAKCEQLTELTQNKIKQSEMQYQQALAAKEKQLDENKQKIQSLERQLSLIKEQTSQKITGLQNELNSKDADHRIKILELQQEKALLNQKNQFIQRECGDKTNKNKALIAENENYVMIFEQKDQKIEELMDEIEELKSYDQAQSQQIEQKISEMAADLQNRANKIRFLEEQNQKYEAQIRRKNEEIISNQEQISIITRKSEQSYNRIAQQLQEVRKTCQNTIKAYEQQIQKLKLDNQKYLQDQKRTSELSLVQLKNFYEMQKQRLQKKILQERRKYQFNQAKNIQEIQNKYRKMNRSQNQEIIQLKSDKNQLEQRLSKLQNQYQIKLNNIGEDIQNQRSVYEAKIQNIKKKYQQLNSQLVQTQNQYEDQRITYVKKIQSLNFQLSRKQKQIMQSNIKRQNLEATIAKKDSQLENIRKTMHQQIQSSLKKVAQIQAKSQKINEQYMHFKIQAEKQNALCKQRNEFLSVRLAQISKQKQSGSMKNLQKLDRTKISQLKQQVQKVKAENMSLQAKIENLRKNQKQSSLNFKKQNSQLEKQNTLLGQRLQLSEMKVKQLESKASQKVETFMKDIEQMRVRYQKQREKLQSQINNQKQKINILEDQKNNLSWKLQKQVVLVTERIKFVEYQRDQNKRELQETQRRLQGALNQLKRSSDKAVLEESGVRRQSIDKRYTNQLQLMKMSSKVKQEELQQLNKRLKQENKQLKQKNIQYHEKIGRLQKSINANSNINEEIQKVKKEKNEQILSHRNESFQMTQQFKKRLSELEKKNRELERKNTEFIFILQKEKTKANMEREAQEQKIKQMQDRIAWQMRKQQQLLKKNSQISKSNSTKQFSMTASDVGGWR